MSSATTGTNNTDDSEECCVFCLDALPSEEDGEDSEGRTRGRLLVGKDGVSGGASAACTHSFHFVCVVTWSARSSRCPVCRADFDAVKNVRGGDIVEVDKANTLEGTGGGTGEEGFEDVVPLYLPEDLSAVCFICGLGDREEILLLCDSFCGRACHTVCCGLEGIPSGDWHCPACRGQHPSSRRSASSAASSQRRRDVVAAASSSRTANESRTVERARQNVRGASVIDNNNAGARPAANLRRSAEINEAWLHMRLAGQTTTTIQARAHAKRSSKRALQFVNKVASIVDTDELDVLAARDNMSSSVGMNRVSALEMMSRETQRFAKSGLLSALYRKGFLGACSRWLEPSFGYRRQDIAVRSTVLWLLKSIFSVELPAISILKDSGLCDITMRVLSDDSERWSTRMQAKDLVELWASLTAGSASSVSAVPAQPLPPPSERRPHKRPKLRGRRK